VVHVVSLHYTQTPPRTAVQLKLANFGALCFRDLQLEILLPIVKAIIIQIGAPGVI